MKRTDVEGARYDLMRHVDPEQLVAELIARWVSDEELDVHPSLVTLRLVKCGPGVPRTLEEAAANALEPLEPRHTLREAGVADGSSLRVFISVLPAGACAVALHSLALTVLCCCSVQRWRCSARSSGCRMSRSASRASSCHLLARCFSATCVTQDSKRQRKACSTLKKI